MALEIANFIEDKTYTEWSTRINVMNKFSVRNQFYPNNMEEHEKIIKMFETQRRSSVQSIKSHREYIYKYKFNLSEDERQLWYVNSKEIDAFNMNLWSSIRNHTIQIYIDKIVLLEKKRLDLLLETMMPRIQNELNEERMTQFIENFDKLTPKIIVAPLRRSKRLQQKRSESSTN